MACDALDRHGNKSAGPHLQGRGNVRRYSSKFKGFMLENMVLKAQTQKRHENFRLYAMVEQKLRASLCALYRVILMQGSWACKTCLRFGVAAWCDAGHFNNDCALLAERELRHQVVILLSHYRPGVSYHECLAC